MKKIVVYFSCSGYTKKFANEIAKKYDCDIFEITPEKEYSDKDIDYTDRTSRCVIEMEDPTIRPNIKNKLDNINEYDTIIIGFPIWGGRAPNIINTFLEIYDLTNKKIVPFGTYHSSGIGDTDKFLIPSCNGANYITAVGLQMDDIDSIEKLDI